MKRIGRVPRFRIVVVFVSETQFARVNRFDRLLVGWLGLVVRIVMQNWPVIAIHVGMVFIGGTGISGID